MDKLFLISLLILLGLLPGCRKDEKLPDPVIDSEGNTYKTVKIGDQVWMAENLRSLKLNDGTDITAANDAFTWKNIETPGYCWYNNDESYKNLYGPLYNGYVVSTGKVCPTGWHVPDRDEWKTLAGFLGDTTIAGAKMKETGTEHWLNPNTGADNSSGFTALPAGIRYFEGTFAAINSNASFWSVTENTGNEEWYASLYYASANLSQSHRSRNHGFSIRCLKD